MKRKKKTTLGQHMRDSREAAGLTQTELAEQAGIGRGQTQVSRLELQPDPIQWSTFCRIADALGASLDDWR